MMTHDGLRKAISGLFAYDSGATDSGIHDESLKRAVRDHLGGLSDDDARALLSRVMRGLFLTDEAIIRGYGWEDAMELGKWIERDFGAN